MYVGVHLYIRIRIIYNYLRSVLSQLCSALVTLFRYMPAHTLTYLRSLSHTYALTYIHSHFHSLSHAQIYIHIHTNTDIYLHTYTHKYKYIRYIIYLHKYTHKFRYLHIYLYTHKYRYEQHTQSYTHSYIHTYIFIDIDTYILQNLTHTHKGYLHTNKNTDIYLIHVYKCLSTHIHMYTNDGYLQIYIQACMYNRSDLSTSYISKVNMTLKHSDYTSVLNLIIFSPAYYTWYSGCFQ